MHKLSLIHISTRAALLAAENCKSPVILDYGYIPVHGRKPMVYEYMEYCERWCERSPIPIAINLDHGLQYMHAIACIRAHFTSIMVDRSALPYERNAAEVKELVKIAHLSLIHISGGVLNGKSIPLGCVTLTEEFLKHDPIQKDEAVALLDHCKEQTSVLASEILQGKAKEMMAVGGTATQLAMLELGLPVYQSDKVHGFLLSYEMIHAWYHRLTAMQRAVSYTHLARAFLLCL